LGRPGWILPQIFAYIDRRKRWQLLVTTIRLQLSREFVQEGPRTEVKSPTVVWHSVSWASYQNQWLSGRICRFRRQGLFLEERSHPGRNGQKKINGKKKRTIWERLETAKKSANPGRTGRKKHPTGIASERRGDRFRLGLRLVSPEETAQGPYQGARHVLQGANGSLMLKSMMYDDQHTGAAIRKSEKLQ